MYEYIKGVIKHIYPSYVVLESNNIGYKVLMANPFRFSDNLHNEETVYIYHDVKQDAMNLFGFVSMQEKNLFLKLINVSGIGPKSALAILANEDHSGFIKAVEEENKTYLTKFPGVGKKTAAQIVLDLKGKLQEFDTSEINLFPTETSTADLNNDAFEEAMEALLALGYTQRDVKKVRKQIDMKTELTTDGYIREALSKLMKK
ncbi:MAG: Holliday junction branch migration protein RuvA [Alkalibacterium sp.]|uniref:Holliday junction branch migration protein RuvA n=1 Tax=Alkalibacterium sp. TaxID=1872447 RepID=UPI002647E06E|nr:Holliday junction branch migration protein RuvA [Alkalibacterium sp.]MDN6294997.1 Holliday junction branch migration protein RuvA [Alkalibacterium sp.]MDN6385996.1 Holliday junction branch migration protein RuvA [Alkalibacterium sp.]